MTRRRQPAGCRATGCTSASASAVGGGTTARTSTTGGRSTRVSCCSTTSAPRCTQGCAGGRRWRYRAGWVQFLELGGGITVVAVVCEDLARLDAVADLLRTVGPTLVLTVLLDGPQLASRWTARYASVLADDPGSAVLTLTSLGMVERSRPPGSAPSRVVALWKDPTRGIREIAVDPGAEAVMLSTSVAPAARHSADGRWPADDTTQLRDVGVHQLRAAAAPSRGAVTRTPAAEAGVTPDLDEGDLSVLASWAQALAEAGDAEERDAVVADMSSASTWRQRLGLEAPAETVGSALDALASLAGPAAGDRARRRPARAARPPSASALRRTPAPEEGRPRAVSLVAVADLAAIDGAIAALEAQRGLLGDAVVDTALGPLLAQRAELVGRAVAEQRKLVTVLFSDLVDFTVLSQRLDAEDVRTVIDAYFLRWNEHIEAQRRRRREVHRRRRDGRVRPARSRGGGSPSGDPRRPGDARRRSTSSTPRSPRDYDVALEMRVGIDTGEVVVSTLGDRPGQDFVVVGEIVNRASRLQSVAPPGEHPHLGRHVPACPRARSTCRPLTGLQLKGIAHPVDGYLVLGERPRGFQPRRRRAASRASTPRRSGATSSCANCRTASARSARNGSGRWSRSSATPASASHGCWPTSTAGSTRSRSAVWWFRGRAAHVRRGPPYALLHDALRHPLRHPRQRRPRRGQAQVGARRRAGVRDGPEAARQGRTSSGAWLGFEIGDDRVLDGSRTTRRT